MPPWLPPYKDYDVHVEPVILPFAVLTAMSLWQGKSTSAMVWGAVTLLGGNVTATYVAGIGAGGLLYSGHRRKIALGLTVLGIVAVLGIEHLVPGGIKGGNLAGFYSTLIPTSQPNASVATLAVALLEHPSRGIAVLWYNRWNVYADLAPEGLLGLISVPVTGLGLAVLLENNLIHTYGFSSPQLFQSIPIMPLMVVGTILVLAYVASRVDRHKWLRWAVTCLMALTTINVLLWAVLWIPRLPHHWVKTSTAQAHTLRQLRQQISPHAEVLASNGFVGMFADRQWDYAVWSLKLHTLPIHKRTVYFILSEFAGIDVSSPSVEASVVSYVSRLPNVHLLFDRDDIWAFEWHPAPRTTSLVLPKNTDSVPAVLFTTPLSTTVPSPAGPYLAGTGNIGYILDRYYARETPGTYQLRITFSNTVPINVEIWNATGNHLIERRDLPVVSGIHTDRLIFQNTKIFPSRTYHGWGAFQISPALPIANNIEVRVWEPRHGLVNIYSLGIKAK